MTTSHQAPPWRRRATVALACAALTGCGAEVAGTAATVGGLQAEQARQAKAQQDRIVEAMKAAQQAGAQRAADAASAVE